MTRSILFLLCSLNAAHGALFPDATPAARLDKRQYVGVTTIWSPVTLGPTLAYEPSIRSGGASTVSTYGDYWAWCGLGSTDCTVSTACIAGTVSWPGGSQACGLGQPNCGTEYLYPSVGAAAGLTRPACFSTDTTNIEILYLTSPVSQTSKTSRGSTGTSTPSAKAHSSTPIGAIVGGVVGGLAVIAIVVIVITLLLCRSRRPARAAKPAAAPAQPGYIQQQPPPPQMPFAVPAAYESKHASYASGYPSGVPNAPPPPFQGSPQSQAQPGLYPPQNYSPHGSPVNPQAWYPPQQGSPQAGYQPQQGIQQPATSPMPSELGTSPAPGTALEMPGA